MSVLSLKRLRYVLMQNGKPPKEKREREGLEQSAAEARALRKSLSCSIEERTFFQLETLTGTKEPETDDKTPACLVVGSSGVLSALLTVVGRGIEISF